MAEDANQQQISSKHKAINALLQYVFHPEQSGQLRMIKVNVYARVSGTG